MPKILSMNRPTAVFTTMTLLAISVFAQSSSSKNGQEKTLIGVVSDNMCGGTHMVKDKSAAECTRMCVNQGQKYALVVGKKVYTLEGHEAELDKLAGQRVTLKGTLSGETVNVASVAPTKTHGM